MSEFFPNHSMFSDVLVHNQLPILITDEFDFFRCVAIGDWVYGNNVSTLHNGNLRDSSSDNRYSSLFPNQKLSYWSSSKSVAMKEMKKHNKGNNYITFWAYDDSSSTFPMLGIDEPLRIIDGRDMEFYKILLKSEQNIQLNDEDKLKLDRIKQEDPDCLVYQSVLDSKGVNFLFFEKGFEKLALREVKLYLGDRKGKNTARVKCSLTADYSPLIESYGKIFESIAKVGTDEDYFFTTEYKDRKKNKLISINKLTRRD